MTLTLSRVMVPPIAHTGLPELKFPELWNILNMPAPHIKSAIPRQRHQIGNFVATLLADIDSDDPVEYRYIMAVVEDGQQQPVLFITSERNTGPGASEGRYRLRVIMGSEEKELTASDEWGDMEHFSLAGLGIVAKLMNLNDEQPLRLQ